MYGKVFTAMFDGTLATKGPWQALVTFQQMIALADREGIVDMTPEAISRRTTIPLDIIAAGIEALEAPDPDSRSPDYDGRRIIRLADNRTWGWRLVNYGHYRGIRSLDERREYMRKYQRDRRAAEKKAPPVNPDVNTGKLGNLSSKQEVVKDKGMGGPPPPSDVGTEAFREFWTAYPSHRRNETKKNAYAKWKAKGMEEIADEVLRSLRAFKKSEQWQTPALVPNLSTWLNQNRWTMAPDAKAPGMSSQFKDAI